jgi:hypothetical protein
MTKNSEVIKSVCHSNYEAIKNIMDLYNIEQFDLDCTYSKGAFWKNLPQPKIKTDLYPTSNDVIKANSEHLPFDGDSMKYIMCDLPFIVAGKTYRQNDEGSSIIAKRFEGYANYNELKENYYKTLKELYRVCNKDGFVIFKCQDIVSAGKNHFTHCMVMDMAQKIGFYPRDLFVLITKMRLNSFGSRWHEQKHARKYNCFFWVFEKVDPKVNYDFMNELDVDYIGIPEKPLTIKEEKSISNFIKKIRIKNPKLEGNQFLLF